MQLSAPLLYNTQCSSSVRSTPLVSAPEARIGDAGGSASRAYAGEPPPASNMASAANPRKQATMIFIILLRARWREPGVAGSGSQSRDISKPQWIWCRCRQSPHDHHEAARLRNYFRCRKLGDREITRP